jgi:hypothetical protein
MKWYSVAGTRTIGRQHAADRLHRPPGVFQVEHHELGARAGRQPGDPGGGELEHEGADRDPAVPQPPLDRVLSHPRPSTA